MNEEIDKLKEVNGKLCAEINRQERVIEEQRAQIVRLVGSNDANRARIRELESLVRDMWDVAASGEFDVGEEAKFAERMAELELEVKR